jgi:hypothetical protein
LKFRWQEKTGRKDAGKMPGLHGRLKAQVHGKISPTARKDAGKMPALHGEKAQARGKIPPVGRKDAGKTAN